ncbi:MAG TPA: tyrosinase family protein [Solirubrobacteraceae bacterium]|jgi:tyrosinase|nr:tyrosinase family protein [Solirubrobacteraceae bacterium]
MSTGTVSPQQPAVALRHRLNIDSMSQTQLAAFRAAMAGAVKISDERGYNYQAGIHGLPLPTSCDIAHGHPVFLPWHRAYLYFFELTLRDLQPGVMLPWWDWTTDPAIPAAYGKATVGGKSNPLHSAKVDPLALEQGVRSGDRRAPKTFREPGAEGAPPLPTKAEIEGVLALGSFADFTHQLEQLHNNVHVWVGGDRGHMGDIQFAAFDPIFWAHHAMIDRVWRMWQLRHPQAGVPAALLNEALAPFNMTVAQTLDANALGYDYAVQVNGSSGTGG